MLAVVEYSPWSELDERQHYDYVQYIADDGRLPVLGEDRIHDEVASIGAGQYPRPAPIPEGFAGESYEAFQPPLYYLVAAPAWFVVPNHLHKVGAVRTLGVVLLLGTVVALAALGRAVAGREWPLVLAFANLVLIAPAVMLRSTTVGNAALEPLVTTGFVIATVMAWKRRSYGWLAGAGLALGACLLTRLVLAYLIPVFLVVAAALWWRRGRVRRELLPAVASMAVPVVVLAPWLLWNRSHYDAWTASSLAKAMQEPFVNPDGVEFHLWESLSGVPSLIDFVVPQEWHGFVESHPFSTLALLGLRIVMVPLAVVLLIVFGRRALRGVPSLLCLAPLPCALAALLLSTVVTDWPQMLSRYTFGAMPAFAVGAACVYRAAIPRARDFAVFTVLLTAVTAFAVTQLFWSAFVDGAWPV